jgi:hypothetical protein
VCDNVSPNSGAAFTVTGATGSSGLFTYQWYYQNGLITAPSGSSTIGWTACSTPGSGYNTSSFTPGGTSSNITYACFVIPASPVCGSGQWAANDVQVTVLTTGPTESSTGGASVCIGGTVNLSSSLSVSIPSTYQWYSSTNIGFTSPTTISGATSTTYSPSTSTAGTTYYEVVAIFSGSGCSPATSNVQTVVVYATPTASISGGNSPICYNTSPGVMTATPAGGSGSFTYQWYNTITGSIGGATASTYTPVSVTATTGYYCSVTDVAGCGSAITTTTTITVDANLSATITGGTTTICYNTSPGTFTANGSGGTGTYSYQWYNGSGAIGSATSSTYTAPSLTSSNSYYCVVTSGTCGSVNTTPYPLYITVHANLTATTSGGTTPICYNTAPGTIHVTASGGTSSYSYQWYSVNSGIIGSATSSSYVPGTLTATDGYYCSVTSGACGTVSSTTRTITVDANLSASIAGGTSPICNGTDPGAITATGTGGTGSYTYQWYDVSGSISGATASTFDPGSITTSDTYTCSVTSGSCGTVSSNSVTITVDATVTASISGGATPICYNSAPGTFTASGSGGTGSYTFQWYNGGGSISGATASTYAPGALTVSNSYHCAVTSGSCGTANTSTAAITVDANLTASISGGTTPICYNTDPGMLTATGIGGTGTYTYQWYHTAGSISGATASTYDPGNITAGDTYSCSVTSGSCGTVATNAISISVDGSVSVSIAGGTTPLCYNTAPGTFTATASGGTSSYSYQWYNSSGAISGAYASTYAPGSLTAGNSYTCTVTSGSCGSTGSNTISISVDGNLTASISGGSSPICYNTAPGTFTASVSGGSGSVTYQWYNSGGSVSGATASTYAPGSLTASNSYTLSVTDASCGTVGSNTIGITVNGSLTASIAGGTTPICYNTDPGTLTATVSGGSSSYTYQWYHTAGSVSGATASTYDPGSITASDAYTCSVTDASCGTVGTNSISISVDANLSASISGGTTTVCYNTAPGTFTAAGTGGTGSYTYQWYNSSGAVSGATANTYAPGSLTAANSYSCSVTSGSCGTVSSNSVAITVDAGPATFYPTVTANPLCTGSSTNVEVAGSITGVNYQLQLSNGSNVGTAVAGSGTTIDLPTGTITANTVYQVEATAVGGCTSTTPANINVVAADPDIAFGSQLSGQHYTFGTILNPAVPGGWTNSNNAHGNHWTLASINPPGSTSYSYFNSLGVSVGATTGGTYIRTPVNDTSATPVVDLITGSINATGYTNLSVQWGARKTYGYAGTISLYYRLNGGSWTAVSFTDMQADVTGEPWQLVNNTVQIKLPSATDGASDLQLMWAANQSTDTNYYSMNDIGIYGLGKVINCGGDSILLPYLNTSCGATEYSLTAAAASAWPSTPAFSYVTGTAITGTPLIIAIPSATAAGTYNLDIKVDDGSGHYSGVIQFPVTTDLLTTTTIGLDNCSCNYITSSAMGSAFGNVVTVYAAGGAGSGFYFSSAGLVDTLLTTVDAGDNAYAGTAGHSGVMGVFWSKADGASHTYTISDGFCTATKTKVTQATAPASIPFGTSTGVPAAITSAMGAGYGGGNGISGSFNNAGFGDNNITNVNGKALTCHQRGYFGNAWVTYQVNNMDALGAPLAGDSTNNKAVVEINNNGTDLDSVQVSVYRDAFLPEVPNDLAAVACSGYPEYAMERHFMIKSTKSTGANSFENAVGVRLYFTDAELLDLQYWTMKVAQSATGQTAGCAYADTITNINSIYVTKYTGANEDGNYGNNLAAPSGLYRVFGKNATASGNGPLTAIDAGAATLTTGGTTNLHYVQMNVTEFSEFWLGGSSGGGEALPVQMLYLEAEALNNDSIQVRWATALEINNQAFDVERSTDGNTWTVVDVTPGHGNSIVDEYYTFNDLNVVPGVVYYYRLKQIDNNGNYQYTGIVQAEITGAGAFTVMNFVPNPTQGNTQLTVVTTIDQEITVDFYDMLGQKVLSSIQELTAGTNRIDFNLQRFASGTYSAVVTSENQLYTKKIVVTR